ncbi:sulfatase-like hydrolase/transferase [Altererythrobacter sp. GH1-8]|uniref:sulfatase-like hydrolase/transferase n=1 Tax=Altererythrobacter sp. GH1-8 TaxID=3349333 RepID=UPI00374D6C28
MSRMKRWLERVPLAPFVIPVLLVTLLWQRNRLRLPLDDVFPTLAVLLGVVGAFILVSYIVMRDWRRAALLTTIWTFFLLYAPSFAEQIAQSGWIFWTVIAVTGLIAFDISRRLPREEAPLSRGMLYANVAGLILALPWFVQASWQAVQLEQGRPDPAEIYSAFAAEADNDSPDVWHIVMDRYANAAVLADAYGYDNSPFLKALRERGFAVEDNAFSNYQITNQSLSTTLNANYLDPLVEATGHELDSVPQFEAVRSSQASRFFKSQGYEMVFASTWADISHTHDLADRTLNSRPISQVPRQIIDQSLLGHIGAAADIPFLSGRADQCMREPAKFAELRRIAGEKGRKYVFAHFLLPHPPYLLDRQGRCKSVAEEINWDRKRNYIEQLEYANAELLKLIDAILAGPRPATIMIHGDEGPYPEIYAGDEKYRKTPLAPRKSWANAAPELWREKTGILMAVRHAEGETDYAPPTPINLYSIVLNRDFNGTLEMREERNFIFRDVDKIHKFTDVTNIVRGSSAPAD